MLARDAAPLCAPSRVADKSQGRLAQSRRLLTQNKDSRLVPAFVFAKRGG